MPRRRLLELAALHVGPVDENAGETFLDPIANRFIFEITTQDGSYHQFDESSGAPIEARSHLRELGNMAQTMYGFSYSKASDVNDGDLGDVCEPPNATFNPSTNTAATSAMAYCNDYPYASCTLPAGNCSYGLWTSMPGTDLTADDLPRSYFITSGSGNGSGWPMQQVSPCGVIPWDDTPSFDALASNAYLRITELAEIKQHESSFFYYAQNHPGPVKLYVQTISPTGSGGQPAYAVFDRATRRLRLGPNLTPGGIHAATDLRTMAHEYGHFIFYILGGGDNRISVDEGFADHNVLRYMIYQNFAASPQIWSGLSYYSQMSNIARTWKHADRVQHGERVLEAYHKNSWPQLYYPDEGSCALSGDVEVNPYNCGAIIGITYWELAWNNCKLGFAACDQNEEIVSGGIYAHLGWRLANSTYAYAASIAVDGWTPATFMDGVIDRYWQFRINYNYLDPPSYDNVSSVLSHHCVGWSDHCSDPTFHKFPGSKLPSLDTRKVNLVQAEARTPISAWSTVSDSTAYGGSAVLLSFPDVGSFSFPTVAGGLPTNRKLFVAAKKNSSNTVTLRYRENGGTWKTSPALALDPSFAWTWLELGNVTIIPNATNTIELQPWANSATLDVVVIDSPLFETSCLCSGTNGSPGDGCP